MRGYTFLRMASAREVGPGLFEVRWYERTYAGETRQRSKRVRASSKREAERRGAILETAERAKAVDYTLGHAVADVIRHGGRRTAKSNFEVERRARLHILPALGDTPVTRVTPVMLERFYGSLARQGLAPGTIRHVHSDVTQALFMAKRDGWVATNVAESVILPALVRKPVHPPDVLQLRAIIDLAESDATGGSWACTELLLLLRLAAVTGARLGELMAFRHLDLAGHGARIHHSVEAFQGAVRVKGTKTDQQRTVPLPIEIEGYLDAHCALTALRWGRTPTPADFVFISTRAPFVEPLSPPTMNGRYMRLLRRLPFHVRLHDFRHFAASSWLHVLPAIEASYLTGHSKTSTTTDIYGHLLEQSNDGTVSSILAPILRRGAG